MKRPAAASPGPVAKRSKASVDTNSSKSKSTNNKNAASSSSNNSRSGGSSSSSSTSLKLLNADDLSSGRHFAGKLDERGSELSYDPHFADGPLASRWLQELQKTVEWGQGEVKIFGRTLPEPRLTAYYGDAGMAYTYSSRTVEPKAWASCPTLASIKEAVQEATGLTFNSVLCNRYRSGNDTMGWHSDDEALYGPSPSIASVSFGAERDFDLRERASRKEKLRLVLGHGSLLLMAGTMQSHWQHALPKRKRVSEERINLTFRRIVR